MAITVHSAARLGGLKHSRLVAGEKGLDRLIGWVDVLEVPDASLWLRENELLVTTCYAVRNDPEGQLAILRSMARSGAAALAVKFGRFIGQPPPEMIRLANELAIPLFDVPDGISFMDITHPVMAAIINSQAKLFYKRDLLEDLINGVIVNREQALLRARTVDLRLDEPYVIIIADVDGFNQLLLQTGNQHEHLALQIKSQLLSTAEECFAAWFKRGLAVSRSDSIIGILPIGAAGNNRQWRKRIHGMAEQLQELVKKRWPTVSLTICISRLADDPLVFGEYYRNARQIVRLVRKLHGRGKIAFRDDMEIYGLLDDLGKPLEVFYDHVLGVVDCPAVKHREELLETLEVYIECQGNAVEAAQKLFIHRNTLRYRLERLQEILGYNWDEPEKRFTLWMALRIRRLINRQE